MQEHQRRQAVFGADDTKGIESLHFAAHGHRHLVVQAVLHRDVGDVAVAIDPALDFAGVETCQECTS